MFQTKKKYYRLIVSMTKSKVSKKDEQLSETKSPKVEKKAKVVKDKEQENPKTKSKTTEKKTKPKDATKEEAKRSFKGIYVNCEGVVVLSGRYCGKKPMQAARKALTGIYRLYNNYNKQHPKNKKLLSGVVYFGVKETSRQSKHKKIYWYAGEKQELEVPHERELNTIDEKTGKNKVIIHKSKNEVKKASLDDCKHLMQYVEDDEEEDKPKKKTTSKKTKKAQTTKKLKEPKETVETVEVTETTEPKETKKNKKSVVSTSVEVKTNKKQKKTDNVTEKKNKK